VHVLVSQSKDCDSGHEASVICLMLTPFTIASIAGAIMVIMVFLLRFNII